MTLPQTIEIRKKFALDVVLRLKSAGFEALWAGGCVRDLLLGLTPADFDVATNARPEQVMRLFRRTIPVGISFGVVRVLGAGAEGEVEVATFRSDGEYEDGRRPESVTFGSAELDAQRRDFTINGMFLDPTTDSLIDYVGGRDDLTRRMLRAIGHPADRFEEDKLRLLRAVRFAARFGLAVEPETLGAIRRMAPQVGVVAIERIAQELRKMLVHGSRSVAMEMARDLGLLREILPHVAKLADRDATTAEGGDVDHWARTMVALDHLPEQPGFPLALAALLHRVGWSDWPSVGEGSDPSGFRDLAGRRIAIQAATDLKVSNQERDLVGWLVEFHRYLCKPEALRESALKRILATPAIGDLLALHRAVALAEGGDAAHVDYCAWYLREEPCGPLNPPPLLTGDDLRQMGFRPGPRFREWLDSVREAQLDRTINDKDQAIAWVNRLNGESG